jgi:hypothetical protein
MLMPFGKYKGHDLAALPDEYLLWVSANIPLREPLYTPQLIMHLFSVPWPHQKRVVEGKMYRILLTPDEEQELEQTFKTTPDRRVRDRCQAVLMAARGRARRLIAQD